MRKLINYLFYLAIVISSVLIVINIINFSKRIIILNESQYTAEFRKEIMLEPVVKLTQLSYETIEKDGEFQSAESTIFATGFSVEYNPSENKTIILTNDHFCNTINKDSLLMVERYDTETVFLSNSDTDKLILSTVRDLDLCAIEISGYVRPAKLADNNFYPKPFEEIFIVGGPSGDFPIIVDTYVSMLVDRNRIEMAGLSGSENSFLLISEQVFPGHSGSPIYTKDGRVVGILFGALRSYGGLAASNQDIHFFLGSL